MVTLGFVGLGRMGGSMATHLVRNGHEVVVYDSRPEAVEAMAAAGATPAESAGAVGDAAEVVFLSLPGPEAVEAVASELAATTDADSVVVDTTTSTPGTTRAIADPESGLEATVLGAPVSGGVSGAEDGTLTVMVGGDRATFEACRAYVDAFAENVFHVGDDPGHGHAVKLLNNYLSATAMVATSEAVALGQRAGLDIETMCEIFNVSSGRNSATEEKFPEYVANGRDVGFAIELLAKDLRLLGEFAEDKRLPLLLAGVVRSQVGRTRARYGEEGDMTDIYDYVRETTGADEPTDAS
ncbi:NAD(P)-dependent oxidoreductase [Halorientalis litorea]|jgi:3-hydroxyisobutyrate dehydrogenase-like beta-hydroxyacid dehydrogenase|uniref:NAD(P)-dependent oxidoreductase n=1 Tax=Halorientalis litorea TaxID=2931977 RepID=UPI001FF5FB7B|nr:NAD(P)-dependent oxidoreductase [Halorientalis litorea]